MKNRLHQLSRMCHLAVLLGASNKVWSDVGMDMWLRSVRSTLSIVWLEAGICERVNGKKKTWSAIISKLQKRVRVSILLATVLKIPSESLLHWWVCASFVRNSQLRTRRTQGVAPLIAVSGPGYVLSHPQKLCCYNPVGRLDPRSPASTNSAMETLKGQRKS